MPGPRGRSLGSGGRLPGHPRMHTPKSRMRLDRLPTWAKKNVVHVVVEAPRDCRLKLRYEPELGAITWGHPLPIGFAYPYDWGFVPSTMGPDGDPLDALVLSEIGSHPGVVIPCRPFGVMQLDEKANGGRERNDRLVVVPLKGRWTNEVASPQDMPRQTIEELEHFFLSSVFFTHKDARCLGWKGPKTAVKLVEAAAAKNGKRSSQ